jgi:hypothetical protein
VSGGWQAAEGDLSAVFRSERQAGGGQPRNGTNETEVVVYPPPHHGTLRPLLICRRLFYVIDDEDIDGSFGRFQFQSELLLNCGKEIGRRVGIVG